MKLIALTIPLQSCDEKYLKELYNLKTDEHDHEWEESFHDFCVCVLQEALEKRMSYKDLNSYFDKMDSYNQEGQTGIGIYNNEIKNGKILLHIPEPVIELLKVFIKKWCGHCAPKDCVCPENIEQDIALLISRYAEKYLDWKDAPSIFDKSTE